MNNKNHRPEKEKTSILSKLTSIIGINKPVNVSPNNRITGAYFYGFDEVVSSSNRILGASIELEEVKELVNI